MEEQEDFKANSAKDIVLILNPTRYTVQSDDLENTRASDYNEPKKSASQNLDETTLISSLMLAEREKRSLSILRRDVHYVHSRYGVSRAEQVIAREGTSSSSSSDESRRASSGESSEEEESKNNL